MADYAFYIETYRGGSIPEADFPRIALRAEAQLRRYHRIYTVKFPEEDSEDMAVCAMADALYYFECAQSGEGLISSASIGSVSVSYGGASNVDVSPKAQARELYRCASLYLDIYRGCSSC